VAAGCVAEERGEARVVRGDVRQEDAQLVKRTGEGVLLRLRVDPPVRRIGKELTRRFLAGAGDPMAPARGRGLGDGRLRRHRATPDLRPCIVAPPE